mmetsp:Transcript_232/g.537  ORF Transcript_232/g.537 Transcript_232/m.537 type:complete len:522 (+) Transcript_232:195-1760(+)
MGTTDLHHSPNNHAATPLRTRCSPHRPHSQQATHALSSHAQLPQLPPPTHTDTDTDTIYRMLACGQRPAAPPSRSALEPDHGAPLHLGRLEVLVAQLVALDLLLLVLQPLTLLDQVLECELHRLKGGQVVALDQPLAERRHVGAVLAHLLTHDVALDPLPDLGVVRGRAQRAEKVERLVREAVQQPAHVLHRQPVILVHGVQDVDKVGARRLPVELVHSPVTDEGREHFGEVVARDDDGRAAHVLVRDPVLARGHRVGVVAQVHERAHHNLVVHRGLCVAKVAQPRVDVVDEQHAELAAHLGQVARLFVALADHLAGRARPLVLQLTRAHHHRLRAQLLERQLRLERLAHALLAPDAQDERDAHLVADAPHLNQVVLGHVHRDLVQEGGGHVVVAHQVAERPELPPPQAAVRNVGLHAQEVAGDVAVNHVVVLPRVHARVLLRARAQLVQVVGAPAAPAALLHRLPRGHPFMCAFLLFLLLCSLPGFLLLTDYPLFQSQPIIPAERGKLLWAQVRDGSLRV